MSDSTFTFRVDEALKSQFIEAAQSRDRSGAQLLRDFMRDFVWKQQQMSEHDSWFRREVQTGLDMADAGKLIAAEDVEAEAVAWREAQRQKLSDA